MTTNEVNRAVLAGVHAFGVCVFSQAGFAQEPPPLEPDATGVIFAIGDIDNKYRDFKWSGWNGIHDYECIVGVDCETGKFPSVIYHMDFVPRFTDRDGVATARIRFYLANETENVILRLARAGAETLVVNWDNEANIDLPADLFDPPSADGFVVGIYDLAIGTVPAGMHVIEFSMKAGPSHDGGFGWDAVILRVAQSGG